VRAQAGMRAVAGRSPTWRHCGAVSRSRPSGSAPRPSSLGVVDHKAMWTRLVTSIMVSRRETWALTAASLMQRFDAISAFEDPVAADGGVDRCRDRV